MSLVSGSVGVMAQSSWAEGGPAVSALTSPQVQALSIRQAYELALQHDPRWQSAQAQARSRAERLAQAKGAWLPAVNASLGRSKVGQTTEVLSPFSSADTSYTSSNTSITARQPLFNKGRWNMLQQAEFAALEAQAMLAQEHQDVLQRVSQAYLEVLVADERAKQVTYLMKAAQASWDAARRSLDLGSGTRTDMDEALARLDMTRAQQLQTIQQQDFSRRQLQVMIKLPVQSVVPLSGQGGLAESIGSLAALDDWLNKALSQSPEVQVFQARLEGARKELDKQTAGHYPTLDAVAQYSDSSNENVTRLGGRYKTQSLGLQLQIPIYAGGQVLSQERQAQADIEVAQANLEALRRDLGLRVQKEFRGLTEGQLRLVAQDQALRSAGQLVCSSQRSYAAGSRTLVDWLNAQRQQAQAEMDWIDTRTGQLISAVRLWSVTGRDAAEILTELEQEFEGANKAKARSQFKCPQASRV
jgi:outer membrane protein/protease secretion system outer membrane protein